MSTDYHQTETPIPISIGGVSLDSVLSHCSNARLVSNGALTQQHNGAFINKCFLSLMIHLTLKNTRK